MNDKYEPPTPQYPTNDLRPIRIHHMKQLRNSIRNFPLVVITADSGYAKAQVAYHFVLESGAFPAWILLTDSDNLTQHFWNNFLASDIVKNPRMRTILEHLGFPRSRNELNYILKIISKNLLLESKVMLIFEGFEVIYRVEILEFIEKLATMHLNNLQIFILSKTIPDITLTRLVLKNTLIPITQDEIRFTKEEYLELLSLTSPSPKAQSPELLYDYFDGKPVPLVMTCFYDHVCDSTLVPIDLDKPKFWEQFVLNYFEQRIPLLFFLYLRMFRHINQEIWDIIPVTTDYSFEQFIGSSALTMNILYTQNYEFLDFYQDIFAESFNALDSNLQSEIYSFVADYYMGIGDLTESILLYQKAHKYDQMLKLLQELFTKHNSEYDYLWFIDRIEGLPPNILKTYPKIQLIYSALLYISNRKKAAQIQCDALIEEYTKADSSLPMKQKILGEAYTLKGIHALWNADSKMNDYFYAATGFLDDGTSLFSNYLSCQSHIPTLYAPMLTQEGWHTKISTSLSKAEPYMASILHDFAAGLASLFDAHYYYQIGKFDKSEALAQQCIKAASANGAYGNELYAHYILLDINLAKGDLSNAYSILKIMQQKVYILKNPVLSSYLEHIQAKFYLVLHETKKIPSWLTSGTLSKNCIWGDIVWNEYFLHALFLYYNGSFEALNDFMPALEQAVYIQHGNTYTNYLDCYTLKALNELALNKAEAAIKLLEDVYHKSQFSGHIMRFAEHSSDMIKLLDAAKKRPAVSISAEWIEQVYAAAKKYNTVNKKSSNLIDIYQLTKKELEILKYLAKGLSDAEIAEKAATTVATVKWYNRQIYSKLDVKNRTGAARFALEVGLISPDNTN